MVVNEKILDVLWFSSLRKGCIGVVAVNKPHISKGWSAYIGKGDGAIEFIDIREIIEWGTPLSEQQALGFFPQYKDLKYCR